MRGAKLPFSHTLWDVPLGTEMDNNASEVPVPTIVKLASLFGLNTVHNVVFRVEALKSSEIILLDSVVKFQR